MFDQLGWGELAVLALVALVVFGPDRLPQVARDAARMLRQLRAYARDAQSGLREELGPDVTGLADLHPRRFLQQTLLGDDEEPRTARPAGTPVALAGERPPYDVDAT